MAAVITRWEWFFLLLLLPLFLFPTGLQSLLLLLLPALWLARWVASRHFFPPTPYDVAILGLAVMLLISLGVTIDITLSFVKIAGILLGVTLFYGAVAYTRRQPGGIWHLLAVFLLLGAGMAAAGLFGLNWPAAPIWLARWQRLLLINSLAIRSFVNPNEMAGVLNWVAPLMTAMVVGWRRLPWRGHRPAFLLLLVVWLVTTGMLLATRSRGGILSFAAGLLLMLALTLPGRWRVPAAAGIGAAVVALLLNLVPLAGGVGAGIDQLGLAGRLEIWSRALYALADFPITGMGLNGFRHLVHILYPLFLIPPGTDIAHAHNHLLQAGLDLGLPGLIAYLALWLISLALLRQSLRSAALPAQKTLIIGLCGSLAAGWTFGILDAVALGARPGFMWWLLLALVAAAHDDACGSVSGRP